MNGRDDAWAELVVGLLIFSFLGLVVLAGAYGTPTTCPEGMSQILITNHWGFHEAICVVKPK